MLLSNSLIWLTSLSTALAASGITTRYWDCCKPSCSWPSKASVSSPVLVCSSDDSPLDDPNLTSGCEGGPAYTCTNNSPYALNDVVSFGFAATKISGGTEASWCCACYELTFTSGKAKGKKMVVQSTNTGGDLGDNHFDLLMPGGGMGVFDGCSSQFGGIPGAQYGGISSIDECAKLPTKLQAGCKWRFQWFLNSDNPTVDFQQVQCPAELTAKTGCTRDDDDEFPAWSMPSVTTWSPPAASETAAAYGQCDGPTWDAPKFCPAGFDCKAIDNNWSQCVEGATPTATVS